MSDVLVVASKVKKYIKDSAQMSTSAGAMATLTELVKKACDEAVANSKSDGRKTVMDRDFSAGSSTSTESF